MRKPKITSIVKDRFLSINRERWFRWMVSPKDRPPVKGFFDEYSQFLFTSATAAHPYRLNERHRALIQANADIIRGHRILDIASHDGRWSFAAYKGGAEHVLGIEARAHLIELARENMRQYGVPNGRVEFVQGDVLAKLDQFEAGQFDTVFCFGLLYHIIDHMLLLRKVARLKPTNLVIDTAITTFPASIVEVHDEAVAHESAGAVGDPGNPARVVVGVPSRSALELMLRAAGFSVRHYYNWRDAGISSWTDLKEYYMGKRVSLTAVAAHQWKAVPATPVCEAQE